MKGKIEKIWENKSREGDTFWALLIDGDRYTLWDEETAKTLSPGDTIEFNWRKYEKFRRITGVKGVEKAEPQRVLPDRDVQIARMASVRSAVELLKDSDLKPEEKLEKALEMAKRFERYVLKV